MIDILIEQAFIQKFLVKFFISFIILCACVGGCNFINQELGLPNDNPLEQLTEAIIEKKTGLNIDLTPE